MNLLIFEKLQNNGLKSQIPNILNYIHCCNSSPSWRYMCSKVLDFDMFMKTTYFLDHRFPEMCICILVIDRFVFSHVVTLQNSHFHAMTAAHAALATFHLPSHQSKKPTIWFLWHSLVGSSTFWHFLFSGCVYQVVNFQQLSYIATCVWCRDLPKRCHIGTISSQQKSTITWSFAKWPPAQTITLSSSWSWKGFTWTAWTSTSTRCCITRRNMGTCVLWRYFSAQSTYRYMCSMRESAPRYILQPNMGTRR